MPAVRTERFARTGIVTPGNAERPERCHVGWEGALSARAPHCARKQDFDTARVGITATPSGEGVPQADDEAGLPRLTTMAL
jgi:hypothetical protein